MSSQQQVPNVKKAPEIPGGKKPSKWARIKRVLKDIGNGLGEAIGESMFGGHR